MTIFRFILSANCELLIDHNKDIFSDSFFWESLSDYSLSCIFLASLFLLSRPLGMRNKAPYRRWACAMSFP